MFSSRDAGASQDAGGVWQPLVVADSVPDGAYAGWRDECYVQACVWAGPVRVLRQGGAGGFQQAGLCAPGDGLRCCRERAAGLNFYENQGARIRNNQVQLPSPCAQAACKHPETCGNKVIRDLRLGMTAPGFSGAVVNG